jgi:hypothetical protein
MIDSSFVLALYDTSDGMKVTVFAIAIAIPIVDATNTGDVSIRLPLIITSISYRMQ